jgi:hypothetical protein
MSNETYSADECIENREKMHKRINGVDKSLAKIEGGVGLMKWMIPLIITVVSLLIGALVSVGYSSINGKVDMIVNHFMIHNTTADIKEVEANTP